MNVGIHRNMNEIISSNPSGNHDDSMSFASNLDTTSETRTNLSQDIDTRLDSLYEQAVKMNAKRNLVKNNTWKTEVRAN